jgi:putative transposase
MCLWNGCGGTSNMKRSNLHAYEVRDVHQGVARYMTFYSQLRPHRARDGRPPDRVYSDNLPARPTAA